MAQVMTLFAWVWPFVSTWMLLWGLAAAIPIVIHLLNRLRHSQVAWAAMEYLLAALKKRSRRIRIEQWLLRGTAFPCEPTMTCVDSCDPWECDPCPTPTVMSPVNLPGPEPHILPLGQ